MPARCGHCGGTVMSYRRYVLHFRATATCAACGTPVRLRAFRTLVWFAIAAIAGILAILLLTESPRKIIGLLGGVGVLSLVLDWWSWRALAWDPIE